MKTYIKRVAIGPPMNMEYASPKGVRAAGGQQPDPAREKERIREMLTPLVKEAVQRQMKEQQEYYRSRPSLAAKQMEQVFGAGNMERALTPAVSLRVYEKIEDRLRHEMIRKGR
ncbi:MAG: hypothetical protein NC420_10900 [Eubacterium sp.]|nr:hypothetical protein [Eubacterium sp.]MCM1305666.1 hypothetical protein [Butyrivibrio sp.]